MEQLTTLSLSEVSAATDRAQARAEVLLEGHPTGIIVPGEVLEAAVSVADGRYLLFMTDNIIYEEHLTMVLIDLTRGVLDTLRLGAAYCTGYFEALQVSPHAVSFQFLGDTTWTVTVSDTAYLRLPFLGDAWGVSRQFKLKHYLRISADPTPA